MTSMAWGIMEGDVGSWAAVITAVLTFFSAAAAATHRYLLKPVAEFFKPLIIKRFQDESQMFQTISTAVPEIVATVKEGKTETKMMLTTIVSAVEPIGEVRGSVNEIGKKVDQHHAELRDLRHETHNKQQVFDGRLQIIEMKTDTLPVPPARKDN